MAFSPAEWRARQQLAACYRVFALLGWTELAGSNHVSLRVPGPHQHFLVNPYGLHHREVTASSLVKVDLEGQVVGRSDWGFDAADFTPHAALHAHLEQAWCVMQLRTTAGTAVACSQQGLAMSNVHAARLAGRVATHQFDAALALPGQDGAQIAQRLADCPAVIVRHHGLLSWGETLPKAFHALWTLQRACEVQVAGAPLGPAMPLPEASLRRMADDAAKASASPDFGVHLFEALVRQVDREDGSWRE